MKTKKFNKKLTLNKITITEINNKQMKEANGGGTFYCVVTYGRCDTFMNTCLPCYEQVTTYCY